MTLVKEVMDPTAQEEARVFPMEMGSAMPSRPVREIAQPTALDRLMIDVLDEAQSPSNEHCRGLIHHRASQNVDA